MLNLLLVEQKQGWLGIAQVDQGRALYRLVWMEKKGIDDGDTLVERVIIALFILAVRTRLFYSLGRRRLCRETLAAEFGQIRIFRLKLNLIGIWSVALFSVGSL